MVENNGVRAVTISPEEVIEFWLEEVGSKNWFTSSTELDDKIRQRFLDTWKAASSGGLEEWECQLKGSLALLIVLDQFPRNLFRGDGRSFATDARARAVAKKSISKGYDMRTDMPERVFYYMPMMHSESGTDQDQSVRLFKMNVEDEGYLRHACIHREVIRKFGRFPYRNDALGRDSSAAETAYLADGGYAQSIRAYAQ